MTFEETTDGDERVALSATAALEDGDRAVFQMYYAMKHFFSNGGGPCYVVSTGETHAVREFLDSLDRDAIRGECGLPPLKQHSPK